MTMISSYTLLLITSASLLVCTQTTVFVSAQKFDPYQLNGGLVSAVAGKDYVLIASDTRLTDGGYGINSRRYLSGRIWSASSSSSSSPSATQSNLPVGDGRVDATSSSLSEELQSTIIGWRKRSSPAQFDSDGSLIMPSSIDDDTDIQLKIASAQAASALDSTTQSTLHSQIMQHTTTNLPIMIGSAGCASDCESLKRRMRLELDALECTFPSGSSLGVQSVANLLQQILYGRRGFPYYAFCVVAGIDQRDSSPHGDGGDGGSGGSGAVYVYDAIGSYERVAVASAGTGRELLQPILDRLFSGSMQQSKDTKQILDDGIKRDMMAVPAGRQRMGVAGSLRPPVQTTVSCSWEEAVKNVARAYQSVAEREISVGDEIVICVVNTSSEEGSGPAVNVFSYPLKKH